MSDCQRKPGRSKRSRLAFDLNLITIEKLSEKITNGKIKTSCNQGPPRVQNSLIFSELYVSNVTLNIGTELITNLGQNLAKLLGRCPK